MQLWGGSQLVLTATVQSIQWPFLIAVIIASASLLTAVVKAVRAVKYLSAPIRQFLSEHDVMWEDYNIRTGGTYRRATGRGNPPDPEEFHGKRHRRIAGGD